jgi:5-methylcytosine-specific restriction protein A
MPLPPSPCIEPGCPNPATSRSRCDLHHKAKRRTEDSRRPSSRERGHTPRWAAFRKQYLATNPYCRCDADDCHGTTPCLSDANNIDHIDGSGRNGPRAYDPTNLQPLCQSCHSRKTATHDGGFGR